MSKPQKQITRHGKPVGYPVWTADLMRNGRTGEIWVNFEVWNEASYFDKVFTDDGPMIRVHDGRYQDPESCYKTKLDAMQAALSKLIDQHGKLKDAIRSLGDDIAKKKG